MRLKYSTASEYITAVHKYKELFTVSKQTLYNEDMFPYASHDSQMEALWTGYYTSRPIFKNNIRKLFKQYEVSQNYYAL